MEKVPNPKPESLKLPVSNIQLEELPEFSLEFSPNFFFTRVDLP